MSGSVTIRLLGPADAKLLDCVAPGVFDNPVDARLAAEFLADARHHLVVAVIDGQVVGMATGVHYIHPDKPRELWVNEVGVAPAHQRQGIGKQLLQALFAHGPRIAPDPKHSADEDRLIAVGRTSTGRPMFVAFTIRTKNIRRLIRPVTARYMHAKEIAAYEKECSTT